jgi:hypothetical protein
VDVFSNLTRKLQAMQAGKHEANSTANVTANVIPHHRNTAAYSDGEREYTADSEEKKEESPGINDEFIPARRSANPRRRVSISIPDAPAQ